MIDFFYEERRKTMGYPSSWPGDNIKKNDVEIHTPLYKELPGAKVVYRGGNTHSTDKVNSKQPLHLNSHLMDQKFFAQNRYKKKLKKK